MCVAHNERSSNSLPTESVRTVEKLANQATTVHCMRIRTLAIFLRRFKTKSISCFLLFSLMNFAVLLGIPFVRGSFSILNQKPRDLDLTGQRRKYCKGKIVKGKSGKLLKNGRTVHRSSETNPVERPNL